MNARAKAAAPRPLWRRILRGVGIGFWSLVGVAIVAVGGVIAHCLILGAESFDAQKEHLAALRAEYSSLTEEDRTAWTDPAVDPETSEKTRYNRLRFVATHNSYAQEPSWVQRTLINLAEPGEGDRLQYTHETLSDQLDAGIRAIELDVYDRGEDFVVEHVPLVGNRSTSPDFALALQELRLWSDAHPAHAPITVQLEIKDEYLFLDPTLRPFHQGSMTRLDAAIEEALDGVVFTPDDLRGDARSVRAAIAEHGWPTLADLRGRILFYFDDNEEIRELSLAKARALSGRQVFTSSKLDDAEDAGFAVLNDPADPALAAAVEAGIAVRTRADADLDIDLDVRDAALLSGATIVSTDFPPSEARSDGYLVELPGGFLVGPRAAPPTPE